MLFTSSRFQTCLQGGPIVVVHLQVAHDLHGSGSLERKSRITARLLRFGWPYLNDGSSSDGTTTFFAFSIDISGLLEQGQEGPGQEEGSQAVDLEALAHRLCRELREGNALGKDAGVVDEQVEAVLRAYDVAHLPEVTRI